MNVLTRIASIAGLAAFLAAGATLAQAPGIKRSILQRIDLGNGMEVVMGLAEIAPGGSAGRRRRSVFLQRLTRSTVGSSRSVAQ